MTHSIENRPENNTYTNELTVTEEHVHGPVRALRTSRVSFDIGPNYELDMLNPLLT